MRALRKHSIEILPINHKQFGFDHLRSAVTSPWLLSVAAIWKQVEVSTVSGSGLAAISTSRPPQHKIRPGKSEKAIQHQATLSVA